MTRALQTSAAFVAALVAVILAMLGGLMARDPAAFEGLALPDWSAPALPSLTPRLPVAFVPRAQGPDGVTQGRFVGADGAPAIIFERGEVTIGDGEAFATLPSRILTGDDRWNAQGGRLADLLAAPRDAQIELRRIVGEAPACAAGRSAGWLLVSHEGAEVAVGALSERPGPEASAGALCAVHRARR